MKLLFIVLLTRIVIRSGEKRRLPDIDEDKTADGNKANKKKNFNKNQNQPKGKKKFKK